MKKTIYLIIISILTIGCIVFGAMYHVRGHEGFNFRNWISIGKSFSGDFDWDFDVDDLMLNTLGGLIGYAIYFIAASAIVCYIEMHGYYKEKLEFNTSKA